MHTLRFRRLGFQSRREGLIIRKRNELRRVARALLNEERWNPAAGDIERFTLHQFMTTRNAGFCSDASGSSINYSLCPGKWSRHKIRVERIRWHEEIHLLFGQIGQRYGDACRRRLIANLIISIPSRHQHDMFLLVKWLNRDYSRIKNPMSDVHEEILANLFSYVNDSLDRRMLRKQFKLTKTESRKLHCSLRDVARYVQAAAEVATPNWLYSYRPWALRSFLRPEEQISFEQGPAAQIGPWARSVHW